MKAILRNILCVAFPLMLGWSVIADDSPLTGMSQNNVAEQKAVVELRKAGLSCEFGKSIGDGWWTNYAPVLSPIEKEALADHVVWCETPLRIDGSKNPKLSKDTLAQLQSLKQLRVLRFWHTPVTDGDLQNLETLSQLRELMLDETKISDAGLSHLSGLKELRVLSLAGDTNLTDAGLIHLAGLTNLQKLALYTVPITGTGFVQLENMSNLKGLKNLSKLTSLAFIDANNTQVTDAGLSYLIGLTNLEFLALSYTSDVGLERLVGLGKLKRLSAVGTNITDVGMRSIAKMTSLENLDFFDVKISDAGLKSLVGNKNLKKLSFDKSGVTREAAVSLHEALPDCEITIGLWDKNGRHFIHIPESSAPK
jgi:hypothetical protein